MNYTMKPLDKKYFKIQIFGDILEGFVACITYKGVPLWTTISTNLEDYEFYLVDESKTIGKWYVACKDECGDYYTYGYWNTKEEVEKWLQNPYPVK